MTVALDAADQDNELAYKFTPATLGDPARPVVTSRKMLVKPPRQRWIGRPEEKRIQVFTKTGEEANQAKFGRRHGAARGRRGARRGGPSGQEPARASSSASA